MKNNNNIEYVALQISDLHVFDNTDWKIMKDAYDELPYKDKIGLILITGDLHQYKDNYDKTIDFLEQLIDMFNLSKKDVFIIPGNHDSGDCDAKEAYTQFIENNIDKNKDCYKDYFTPNKLISCFKDYSAFIEHFYGDLAKYMYPHPEQVGVITWNNQLNIIHLNTAINCNGNNELKQIIDVYKFSDIINKIDNNKPSIILAHHSIEKIHTSHREVITRYITRHKVSAYMCGDDHKEKYIPIETHSAENPIIPCFICGKSSYEIGDTYSDIGCILYIKEYNSNEMTAIPYDWDSHKLRFSRSNTFDTDEGYRKFPLLNMRGKDKTRHSKKNVFLTDNESIWLPDAEKAIGTQSRFESFTSTNTIDKFLQKSSRTYGISAVKGIGKTFVLQIKRRLISKDRLCLPIGIVPAQANGWGMEAIKINSKLDLSHLKEFDNVILLWKYCIIVYVVNQLISLEDNELIFDQWWEKNRHPSKIMSNKIQKFFDDELISQETYKLCNNEDLINLNQIMNKVLSSKSWASFVCKDIQQLPFLYKTINGILTILKRSNIVVFIDRTDQAIRTTNAEPPVDCSLCHKRDKVNTCNNPLKGTDYCADEKHICRNRCCYGCETYETPYSNTNLRIYGTASKYQHITLWQYLQVGLLQAVNLILDEFQGCIEVYFTIREEVFKCEPKLLGNIKPKLLNIVKSLHYTKDEQRKIFYDCIRNQQEEFLFAPNLVNNNNTLEEAFVGVSLLCHPYVDNAFESVFDSIYRHSFDRSRDIQEYGQMFTEHMDEIRECKSDLDRGECVKRLIEERAAKLAFDIVEEKEQSYYEEKYELIPNFWADAENFKRFIMLISQNLMFYNDVRKICRTFNQIDRCKGDCFKCTALHHPFSLLYKLGMLGQIQIFHNWNKPVAPDFLHSSAVTFVTGEHLININKNTIYVLHPALTKSIEKLNKKVLHFNGFVLGKEQKIETKKLDELVDDYEKMTPSAFRQKYFKEKQ